MGIVGQTGITTSRWHGHYVCVGGFFVVKYHLVRLNARRALRLRPLGLHPLAVQSIGCRSFAILFTRIAADNGGFSFALKL